MFQQSQPTNRTCNRFKFRPAAALALLAALHTLWAALDAFAANYTWDAGNTKNAATIDP